VNFVQPVIDYEIVADFHHSLVLRSCDEKRLSLRRAAVTHWRLHGSCRCHRRRQCHLTSRTDICLHK